MTETQWLTSTNPNAMLRHVGAKASARKLRLLAVACCRRVPEYFADDQFARLVDLVERQAEGEASHEEWQWGVRTAHELTVPPAADAPDSVREAVVRALLGLVSSPPVEGADRVLGWTAAVAVRAAGAGRSLAAERTATRQQADLLREVFGNPFLERTVVPAWMSTGGSAIFPNWMIRVSETAKALADGVQADQAFERLPILADALEEAGCTDTDLLAHLREPGHHVRGCWALDLVLGKG
jgi:hypothetical protein